MPVPIILPKFGFTLETADVVQWLVNEGDKVRAGDPICEVTTDKVNMEVEAPEDGTVYGFRYPPGATVPVTEVICYLLRPGETAPDDAARAGAVRGESLTATPRHDSPEMAETAVSATPLARRVAEAAHISLEGLYGSGPNGKIMRRDVESALTQPAPSGVGGKLRATPAARRIAREAGVALANIAGSGPRGRIQGADVLAALETERATAKPVLPSAPLAEKAPPAVALHPAAEKPGGEDFGIKTIRMEGIRRTIALRLQQSFQNAPHIYFEAEIDVTGIEALRQRIKARDEKLSVTAILVKACAATLLRHPMVNATTDGETISLWPTANIGVAVALEQGLVVPVIHHAERLMLREIQISVDTLAERARTNTLHLSDVADGTFTISNLGMYGVDRFTAIINPPQVAILAVGRTVRHFVPDENDQPVLKSFLSVTLSADHRVVDGAVAAQFLADLRSVLEEPALMAW